MELFSLWHSFLLFELKNLILQTDCAFGVFDNFVSEVQFGSWVSDRSKVGESGASPSGISMTVSSHTAVLESLYQCSVLSALSASLRNQAEVVNSRAVRGRAGCQLPKALLAPQAPATPCLSVKAGPVLPACLSCCLSNQAPTILSYPCSSMPPSPLIVPQSTDCFPCLHGHFSRPPPLQLCFSFSLSAKTVPKDRLPCSICSQLVSLTVYILTHPGGGTALSLW